MGRAESHDGDEDASTVGVTIVVYSVVGLLFVGFPILTALFFLSLLTGIWWPLYSGSVAIAILSLIAGAGLVSIREE